MVGIGEIILKLRNYLKRGQLLHNSFEIGIFIKGIDGILEILGGLLLIIINPLRLNKLIILLTMHELSEDPKDRIAHFLIGISRQFSVSSQHFGIFYLLSHGIIKLILVCMLFQRKIWAYPVTIVSLVFFIGYQLYRYLYNHSIWLMILTAFDIIIIILTWIEYQKNIASGHMHK
jgi:uncharacterized membrane protein